MNFLVRKIVGKYFTPEEWANFLVKEMAEGAGVVFGDARFRKLAGLDRLDEEERNRIFNELQVTGIVHIIMEIEDRAPRLPEHRVKVWRDAAKAIPSVFCAWLSELGIPAEFVDTWRKLIDKRLEEYRSGTFETRDVLEPQLEAEESEAAKRALYRLETAAVLSMLHITRGKAAPDDPLKKHLLTWLAALEASTAKNIV
jgi:hypothetical protein